LTKYKKNGKKYALKVLNKKKLLAKKNLKYAISEANILKKVNCLFIIKLYFAFQTPNNLYMALDNCSCGDLS
jgi:serine/threonine protein kinase